MILISSCLLGSEVRYNGGHTEYKWITRVLGKHADFYPVCPEVAMGLGVPREQIHIEYSPRKDGFIVKNRKGDDLTSLVRRVVDQYRTEFKNIEFDGVILQAKSPSCGLERVKYFNYDSGVTDRYLQGFFAQFLILNMIDVPKIDSGRFHDLDSRIHFLTQVFAHYRFRIHRKLKLPIQDFHRDYKYFLMSYHQDGMRELGKIAARNDENQMERYRHGLMSMLALPRKKTNILNTLYHMMGYLKKRISRQEKEYLYRLFSQSMTSPVGFKEADRLLHFLIEKNDISYLKRQYYFNPFPQDLMNWIR